MFILQINKAFNKVETKIEGWLDSFVVMLPNFLAALLIVIFFYILSRIIRRLFLQLLNRISANNAINRLVAAITGFVITVIGLFIALGILQLDKTVTSLLAGAGIIGLAMSLAFQDTFANFISGVILATRSPYKIGDVIESNSHFGTIAQMNLRATIIRTQQGPSVIIPNKMVLQNPIINYSDLGIRRVELAVRVAYSEDLEFVKRVTIEAINKIDYVLKHRDIELYYTEFADSSIKLMVRYWIKFTRQNEYLK